MNDWTKRRKMPATMRAAQQYATRTRHAADLIGKPPKGAPWQEVVAWLRKCGANADGQRAKYDVIAQSKAPGA